MIESDWEKQRHNKQQNQHTLVSNAHNQQEKEAEQQDYQFRYDHVRENRAQKKALFTLKKRHAMRAMVPDVKRVRNDRRLATGRTTQSQTAAQYPFDLFQICLQVIGHILT